MTLLIAVALLTFNVPIRGDEQISPTEDLPLLQRTFQFIATTEDDTTDVILLLTRYRIEQGKEMVLPPMMGSAKIVRGRNLINLTLLPGKDQTLFQFSVNGNGEGYRLITKHATDEEARASLAKQYVFLTKAAWSKERHGLILTEGPENAPERIRCVLTLYHPDPDHEGNPGRIFGNISVGADNF